MSTLPRYYLFLAALAAFCAVALGALGAHALSVRLDAHALALYQTAVHYHLWHALGLGLIALLIEQQGATTQLRWAGGLMLAGILVFCGSLYALALSGLSWLGMITPLGGLAFLGAWLLLASHAWNKARSSPTGSR